jgi:sigma-E factor negative regulatory protein RseB
MRYMALFAVLALPSAAWPSQDPRAWLDRMSNAVQSLSYEGTFIYMRDDDVDSMHIIHGRDKDGVRERLFSLTGEAREFIRDQGVLTCVWAHKHSVVVERTRIQHSVPTALPTDTQGLDDYYRFKITGSDRIAGQACRTITIRPKDDLRYGHKLCVDKNSGMLLKSVMLNAANIPIEEVMFTSIKLLKDIPDHRFKPTMIGKNDIWRRVRTEHEPHGLKPDLSWRIGRIPPGFKVTGNTKRMIAANPQPVQHMILTDGLASVSVFIAKPQNRAALFEGTMHSGALNAFARSVDNYQITVVGEVPEDTVKTIGQSIVYKSTSAN